MHTDLSLSLLESNSKIDNIMKLALQYCEDEQYEELQGLYEESGKFALCIVQERIKKVQDECDDSELFSLLEDVMITIDDFIEYGDIERGFRDDT